MEHFFYVQYHGCPIWTFRTINQAIKFMAKFHRNCKPKFGFV